MSGLETITRQQYLERQYRADRYLQHLSLTDLFQRFAELYNNYLVIKEQGKIGLRPIGGEGQYWATLLADIMTEMDLREETLPDGFLEKSGFPTPTWPETPKAITAIKGVDLS